MQKTLPVSIHVLLLLVGIHAATARSQTITPSPYWKNQIVFPYDSFCARGISPDSIKWIKFTILLEPYDPNIVYFQNSRQYVFHYAFATEHLDPFIGMTTAQFNAVTLFSEGQQAILGTVILPPADGWPPEARFNEYGIQFVRQDPYDREQVRDMFNLVKAGIDASADVQAFYFPTYEQQAAAEADRDWFESQGIPLASTARWLKGNTCYSEGWALGELKFFPADGIDDAYRGGLLEPDDILLTDGIPAELPFVSGIVSLAPSTPNSHVAILARTYAVPFVHLALSDDAERAQQLVGHRVIFSAYNDQYSDCDTRLIDTEDLLDDAIVADILQLKEPTPLAIAPMAPYGAYGVSTIGLAPPDIQFVGGKASNFGILREAIPESSPIAAALTFDVWNAFLDQPLTATVPLELGPGEHMLFWSDDDEEQGPTHVGFRLSRGGESIALFDRDGSTLIDSVHFGPQAEDVSFGRAVDGGPTWRPFTTTTPGGPNADAEAVEGVGLVINEFMADNEATIEDPHEPGQYPDWIELYNASDETISLNGLYLTDDVNEPTKWQIPPATSNATLRQEIARRLSRYDSYPPDDMQRLSSDLAAIRNLFTHPAISSFGAELRDAVIAVLTDPAYGFDPNANLRFRSSTNVEDSADFIGAGLYDSFSGCLADDLDDDDTGPCACDPNEEGERDVFRAIRRVLASFYNNNAYLERLRHDVNETEVGMAILVHHSFPDEIELANGVATFERKGADENTVISFVTQQGAVSVTNPEDASTPEEVTVTILPSGSIVPPKLQRSSSLIPLGGTVMQWPDDYTDLVDLLLLVSDEFSRVTGKTEYILDLEYKKVAPGGRVRPEGGLVVKQVRQVPVPDETARITPFLIKTPMEFEVFTGEFEIFGETDVFADHRLKSRWTLETYNMALDSNSLSERLYGRVSIEYLDEDRICNTTREISLLPSARHSFADDSVVDSWQFPDMANPRRYRLQTTGIPTTVSPGANPILTLADLGTPGFNVPFRCLTLDVDYERPVKSWYQDLWGGSGLRTTTTNRVYLWPRTDGSPDDIPQERSFASGGISINTSFFFAAPPEGLDDWVAGAGATGPLRRWDRTVIEGLADEPIVLTGYYSQTYRPEHHNLIENFLFEPRLEPGISTAILEQLHNADIRLIHLIVDNQEGNESNIMTYGFD